MRVPVSIIILTFTTFTFNIFILFALCRHFLIYVHGACARGRARAFRECACASGCAHARASAYLWATSTFKIHVNNLIMHDIPAIASHRIASHRTAPHRIAPHRTAQEVRSLRSLGMRTGRGVSRSPIPATLSSC